LNVIAVLAEGGASVRDIVRLDTYVAVSAINGYRKIGLPKTRNAERIRAARATVFVNALMITNALLEIGAIAAID
jgi:enamine deaminase RidA (YjgF/YER057c/UK114 family)